MLLLKAPASPDWFASLAGLLNSFILLLLGALLTWYWKTYDARKKKEEEIARDKAQWRDGRLQAEKALWEALRAQMADTTKSILNLQKDMAAITEILKEFTEFSRMITALTANVGNQEKRLDRHEKDFERMETALDNIRNHIQDLSARRPLNMP